MKYIAYYRVSTKRQGESQLGLKAQKKDVERFIKPELIDKSFVEVETGTNKKHRPILQEAIELCKKHDATLLIAKLDRLARNVSFVSSLMDSKVKFKAVDMPEANELTIHILSAIAQNEAKAISKRIKSALAIKKEELAKEGKKLGSPKNLTLRASKKGTEAIKLKAQNNENNVRALAYLKEIQRKHFTLKQVATKLNDNNFKTSTGKEFGTTQVLRLFKKIES